jgi:hypothetical protein
LSFGFYVVRHNRAGLIVLIFFLSFFFFAFNMAFTWAISFSPTVQTQADTLGLNSDHDLVVLFESIKPL